MSEHTHDGQPCPGHSHNAPDSGEQEVVLDITDQGEVLVQAGDFGFCLSPSEAREFARALLELADEAEER